MYSGIIRVVFKVGVLDKHNVAGGFLKPALHRRSFAFSFFHKNPHIGKGTRNLESIVGRIVIYDDYFFLQRSHFCDDHEAQHSVTNQRYLDELEKEGKLTQHAEIAL